MVRHNSCDNYELERSDSKSAVQRISPVFGTESRYHSLEIEPRLLLKLILTIQNISIRYSVNSSTPDPIGPISRSNVHIVSDQFSNWPENLSGIV